MFGNILAHISKRTLHTVSTVAFLLVVAFFAFTRTQVGRDEMSRQLEKQFEDQFAGHLSIGKLTGNLFNTLYASDLRISDSDGVEVALIDSVVMTPRWTSILRKSFSMHELKLLRPRITVLFDSTGQSNLASIFSVADTSTAPSEAGWTFQGAALEIQDAVLQTTSPTYVPKRVASDHVFDFTNSLIENIWLSANIGINDNTRQLDILQLSGSLQSPRLDISSGASQFVVEDGVFSINEMELQMGRSNLLVSGNSSFAHQPNPIETPFLVEVKPSSIDFDQIRLIFPTLPIHGTANVSALIQGPVSDLTVSWLTLDKNGSHAELAGTIAGFPDSLSADLALTNTYMATRDLKTLLPTEEWVDNLRIDSLSAAAYLRATLTMSGNSISSLYSRGSVEVSSDGGLLSGSVLLNGPSMDSIRHEVSLRSENIDVARWTNRAAWRSDLTGMVRAEGYSTSFDSLYSSVSVSLNDLSWGSRRTNDFSLDATITPSTAIGSVILIDGDRRIENTGSISLGEFPMADIVTRLHHADLGPLLGRPSIQTSVSGEISTRTTLQWGQDFSTELTAQIDSSLIQFGSSASEIAPFDARLSIHPPSLEDSTVLDLRSDLANIMVTSDGSVPLMTSLGNAWAKGARLALVKESNKRRYNTGTPEDNLAIALLDDVLSTEQAVRAESDVELIRPIQAQATVDVFDLSRVAAFMPGATPLSGSFQLTSDLVLSSDTIAVRSSFSSPENTIGPVASSGLKGSVLINSRRSVPIAESTTWNVDVTADSLDLRGVHLDQAKMSSVFGNQSGNLKLNGAGTGNFQEIGLDLTLSSQDFLNEITLNQVLLATSGGAWNLSQPAKLDLYGDATVVRDLNLLFLDSNQSVSQSVLASGIFSAEASDSLSVSFQDLSLIHLSEFSELRHPFGGVLNSSLVLTGGRNQPRVSGDATVRSLSLDQYLLGDLQVSSSYQAGSPNASLNLILSPLPADRSPLIMGTTNPGVPVENDLRIQGSVRLPSLQVEDRGSLDLLVDIDRADLFFFKYIFNEALGSVTGYASGDGSITGAINHPIFDVNMGVWDGRFDIPITQSTYSLEGDVRIDEEAIHIDSGRITDEQNGVANLSGRLLFNDYRYFSLDIDGILQDFQIMDVSDSDRLPFYGNLWASGDLALEGRLYDAQLTSVNAKVRDDSQLYVPLEEETSESDESFIVFEDSLGYIPEFKQLSERAFILSKRSSAERKFLDGLNLDLSIFAPTGSTVHLVIDPLLGDVIHAKSTGTVQLLLQDDEFQTFGQLAVEGGNYQFTAGELLIRRFDIKKGGTISWEGDPVNALLDIPASYRTRASRSGLPGSQGSNTGLIPLIVDLQISGTVMSPQVDLSLSIDRNSRNVLGDYQALEAQLNQPDRAAEYATSVLLTNSFQLTTENITTDSGSQLAFNSVSQLVSAQLNRFLNEAFPNVDFTFGLLGESAADLDVTYGVALRLRDERLIIRGEGVYQGARATDNVRANEGLQGEFVVELRLSSRVSVELFFRRESDILETTDLTNTAGIGVSYQTDFESWRSLFKRISSPADTQ